MFRPNRIGTPLIHGPELTTSTAAFTAAYSSVASDVYYSNVINATPQADFGRSSLHWSGSNVIPAAQKWALGQQFTITAPLNGDTVGIEFNGCINIDIPTDVTIVPFFCRIGSAATTLAAAANSDYPTWFDPHRNATTGTATKLPTATAYRNQLITRNTDLSQLAGTYIHGFTFYGVTGYTNTWFHATMSVRQLNDQQTVGYRDTRR